MKITLDAREVMAGYQRAFLRMYDLPGFSAVKVLKAEAAVMLKTWCARTKVVTKADLETRARIRALRRLGATQGGYPGAVTINAGIKGVEGIVWLQTGELRRGKAALAGNRGRFQQVGRMSSDGRLVSNWYHFTDKAWHDIMDTTIDAEIAIKKEMQVGARSAGLARQSIIQAADALGIDLGKVKGGGNLSAAAVAKARAAMASSGRAYMNGSGSSSDDGARAVVEFTNSLPYNVKAGMDSTIQGIVIGRTKFIEKSYEKGAFDSLRGVMRAFPEYFRQNSLETLTT